MEEDWKKRKYCGEFLQYCDYKSCLIICERDVEEHA